MLEVVVGEEARVEVIVEEVAQLEDELKLDNLRTRGREGRRGSANLPPRISRAR